jgi:hypothetical protein
VKVIVIKKLLAVITMILSVAFLLLCLGGTVGVWVARAPLTTAAVALITSAHDLLQGADALAGDVVSGVSEIRGVAGQIEGTAGEISKAAGVLKEIGPIGDLLSAMTGGTANLNSRLAGIESSAGQMRARLESWISLAVLVRQRVGAWITTGAIGITFFLFWFGLGQASLFVHALEWFRRSGTPPQPGLEASPSDLSASGDARNLAPDRACQAVSAGGREGEEPFLKVTAAS